MTGNYCMYLRKSRADQEAEAHGEGETLARHEHALLSLARSRNIPITKIYREVVSGDTIASRPQMQRLLEEVSEGKWTGVLVMEVERLARGDTIDQGIMAQAFKISGTKIITPVKTYDPNNEFDEEYFEFGLFMSRREYKAINRRLSAGKIASVKEGKVLGGREPYGYRRVRIQSGKGYTFEIVPEAAEIVRTIFRLYAYGDPADHRQMGYVTIAKYLNQLGIPGPTGNVWNRETICSILQNPVYVGMVRWQNRRNKNVYVDGEIRKTRIRTPNDAILVQGLHEPIIDQKLWSDVQKIVKAHPPRVKSDLTLKNPLAGILYCGTCGAMMMRYKRSDRRSDTICCSNKECPSCSSQLDVIERKLLSGIREWIDGYQVPHSALVDEYDETMLQSTIKNAKKEKEQLQHQIDRLYDLLEQGTYDADTFQQRMQKNKEKEASLNQIIFSAEEKLKKSQEYQMANVRLIPRLEHILEVYDTLPGAEEKNSLLKEVIERIEYVKETGGRWSDPDDFSLTIYPRLPKAP